LATPSGPSSDRETILSKTKSESNIVPAAHREPAAVEPHLQQIASGSAAVEQQDSAVENAVLMVSKSVVESLSTDEPVLAELPATPATSQSAAPDVRLQLKCDVPEQKAGPTVKLFASPVQESTIERQHSAKPTAALEIRITGSDDRHIERIVVGGSPTAKLTRDDAAPSATAHSTIKVHSTSQTSKQTSGTHQSPSLRIVTPQ
jgi:hypothetical protein